jgi:hypothetical protein
LLSRVLFFSADAAASGFLLLLVLSSPSFSRLNKVPPADRELTASARCCSPELPRLPASRVTAAAVKF